MINNKTMITIYFVPCDVNGLMGWVYTEDPKVIATARNKQEIEYNDLSPWIKEMYRKVKNI